MFENSGEKIKVAANTFFWLESIASWVVGLYYIYTYIDYGNANSLILGALIAIGGTIAAFVANLLLHGFGDLISTTQDIEDHFRYCRTSKGNRESRLTRDELRHIEGEVDYNEDDDE